SSTPHHLPLHDALPIFPRAPRLIEPCAESGSLLFRQLGKAIERRLQRPPFRRPPDPPHNSIRIDCPKLSSVHQHGDNDVPLADRSEEHTSELQSRENLV